MTVLISSAKRKALKHRFLSKEKNKKLKNGSTVKYSNQGDHVECIYLVVELRGRGRQRHLCGRTRRSMPRNLSFQIKPSSLCFLFLLLPFLLSSLFLVISFHKFLHVPVKFWSSHCRLKWSIRDQAGFPFDLNFHSEDLHPTDTTQFFKIRSGNTQLWGSTTDAKNARCCDGVL